MSSEFVIAAAFTNVHQAHLALSVLEGAGIDAQLADEHTISMDWMLSNAIGGVKVMVPEDRVEEAKVILASGAMDVDTSLAAAADAADAVDQFDLQRFVDAQAGVYDQALAEIAAGRKQSHWMWFIFPQFRGLGSSAMSQRYAIRSRAEARAYLDHEQLGPRLIECAEAALAVDAPSAVDVFPHPDDLKLWSSATLFAAIDDGDSVFERLLEKWFGGEPDAKTLAALAGEGGGDDGQG